MPPLTNPAAACTDCAAFKRLIPEGGRCHRHPPILSVQQSRTESGDIFLDTGWFHPYVENADFCLEYIEGAR